jgi:putative transposase
MLNRTFGCVRVVWNRTLAARQARWQTERKGTSYAQTYKCERAGRTLVVIDRWFPSSKTCSACGHLLAELSLSTRHWTCPSCGARHDRDINAAKNILAAGLAVSACGADIRHRETPPVRPAMKQEPSR